MTTKRWLVDKVYVELSLAGYDFDVTPEEQQTAASNIEAMAAEWLSDGVSIGFQFAADQSDIDLDEDAGIPLGAARAVYLGGAIATAASFGKVLQGDTRKLFAEAYGRLLRAAAFPPEQQLPSTLPVGAGNKTTRGTQNPFVQPPDTGPLQIAGNGGLNLGT